MKIKNLFLSFFAVAALASCKKDDFNYPPGTVGISKIINFPTVAIKGDHLIILNQGATYTDPGVTAMLAGAPTQYTTSTTVSTAAGGLFNIVYTASNAEGYKATDWRTVVVIGTNAMGNDFSGTYLRTGFTTSTWTKTAPGIYDVENPGGATAGAGLHVIAVNYSGTNKIAIPKQDSPDFGIVSSGSEAYTVGAPSTYQWIFFAGGYGTGVRTFTKQ